MAAVFKTPGVYVQEISLFPPSVAEVETAVPAFIGYTEKAEFRGTDLTNVPTRITSLLEYRERFGGEFVPGTVEVHLDESNNYAVAKIEIDKRFFMFEALRMFFDNGGGKCYIVSVGRYRTGSTVNSVAIGDDTNPGLKPGLVAVEKYDEPTMLLFPDAPLLTAEAQFYSLQQAALDQCGKLMDRVAVLDLRENADESFDDVVQEFRDSIGINNLKYGAAYTPWLRSEYAREVAYPMFASAVKKKDGVTALGLETLTSDLVLNGLALSTRNAYDDIGTLKSAVDALKGTAPSLRDRYKQLRDAVTAAASDAAREAAFEALLVFVRGVGSGIATWSTSTAKGAGIKLDVASYGKSTAGPALKALVAFEKNADVLAVSSFTDAASVHTGYAWLTTAGWLDSAVADVAATTTDYGAPPAAAAVAAMLADIDPVFLAAGTSLSTFVAKLEEAAATHARIAQDLLYESHPVVGSMVDRIKKELAVVPPSGAVAGVYARVDSTRGVWKAPANVSLTAVLEPVEMIDFYEQESLNVDVNGGKSINAIRAFSGLGTLVWGARTLAGNDNEWRYVPVRRFFNMVEESVKKSTGWAVFEPNDATLWTKVKGMIDNYLWQKWRDGALQGAKPDEAFYVKVGLGQTMTAQDVLEGRLIVEIGMAVVRPAEFIVLKFAHKMPVS
jgi:hypothetical protein